MLKALACILVVFFKIVISSPKTVTEYQKIVEVAGFKMTCL